MKIRVIVIIGGAALLIAVVVVLALRERWQPVPPLEVPVAALPAEVRVKAVERKPESTDHEVVEASSIVAIVCGADSATADRYEARNDALRSIARRRDLPEKDVAALIAYLRRADNAMRIERVAAPKQTLECGPRLAPQLDSLSLGASPMRHSKCLPDTCCPVSYSNTRQSFNPEYCRLVRRRAI